MITHDCEYLEDLLPNVEAVSIEMRPQPTAPMESYARNEFLQRLLVVRVLKWLKGGPRGQHVVRSVSRTQSEKDGN